MSQVRRQFLRSSCSPIADRCRRHTPTIRAAQLPASFPRVVDGIARRGDLTLPDFHVFQPPGSSEIVRLIFPEGHSAWPGVVLLLVAAAVLAEGCSRTLVQTRPLALMSFLAPVLAVPCGSFKNA